MRQITIQRQSTDEANISLRHVWYDIYVDGEYLTSRDDVCDAMDFKAELAQSSTENLPSKSTIMQPTRAILAHPNYDVDDYAYLAAKGWSNTEILARWTEEAARGNGPCRWEGATARAKLAAVAGCQQAVQKDGYDVWL